MNCPHKHYIYNITSMSPTQMSKSCVTSVRAFNITHITRKKNHENAKFYLVCRMPILKPPRVAIEANMQEEDLACREHSITNFTAGERKGHFPGRVPRGVIEYCRQMVGNWFFLATPRNRHHQCLRRFILLSKEIIILQLPTKSSFLVLLVKWREMGLWESIISLL